MTFPVRFTTPELDEFDRIDAQLVIRAFAEATEPRSLTPEEIAACEAREREFARARAIHVMREQVRALQMGVRS